ncbi:MAG: F0F1 ATP synthase subunit B [Acidimicrobiales bacterium]
MATSNFLVPNGTFIVELIAFLIVLAVVARWVLPPVNKALRDRQAQIQSELAAADQAKADAAAADEERREALDQARQRAREIVEAANRNAERTRADAAAQGQEEHDRLVANANAEVDQARQRALNEATAQVGSLVMEAVERVIGREMDTELHRDLVNEAIAALQSDTVGGTGA